MKTLVYPNHSILNEVETVFINGIKFEICEFIKIAHDEFNINPKNRFFLIVDDCYFLNDTLIEFAKLDVNTAWRRYCTDKSSLKSVITNIESTMDSIDRLEDRSSKVIDGKYNPFKVKIDSLRKYLKQLNINY